MTGANFINGAHLLLFTTDPKADQEALRRILGTQVVPAGEDRVIIPLPAGEIQLMPRRATSPTDTPTTTYKGPSST